MNNPINNVNNQFFVVRIVSAKKFLLKNPEKTKTCATRIFNLSINTIKSSIKRYSKNQREKHNQILNVYQTQIMHELIKSLLTYKIQFIHDLMFDAIKNLKCALDSFYRNLSVLWFRSWWRTNNFHKIKIKSIAVVKYTTTQKHDVTSWFNDYRQAF